jgi:transcriptional regulator with XRE-family HTH domain
MKLTQERLAAIADVSTPTVSRLEGGDKNIQLSSALAILEALGMLEKRLLEFPDDAARYDDNRDVILFRGQSAGKVVNCAISREAIEDHFKPKGGGNAARIAAFKRHRRTIEELAERKFRARQMEPDGTLLIRSMDVERLAA